MKARLSIGLILIVGLIASPFGSNAMAATSLTINGTSVSGEISSPGESDWFEFTVTSTGSYSVETATGTLSDTYLYVYGPNSQSTLVAEDDDGGDGLASLVTASLSQGTYYVKVRAFSSTSTGSYSVRVRSTGSSGGSGYPTLTVDGSAASGEISSGGESDWYQFTVSSSGSITVETGSGSLSDTYLYVYGPNSQSTLVAQDDDGGEGLASQVTTTLSSGTYYAQVRAFSSSSTGSYTIWVESGSGGGGGGGFPVLTVNGSSTPGEITVGGEEDWYELQITSSGSYTIETGSGSLSDTYLYTYGPNSQTVLVAEDDDGGVGLASKLDLSLAAGTYYVKVRAFGSTSTGTYYVRATGEQQASAPPGTTPITVNAPPLYGSVGYAGEAKWFVFEAKGAGQYTIETTAGTLADTYLGLYTVSDLSTPVAEDDDSGTGLASKILRDLSAGFYYVKVRAFSSSATGSYRIQVRTPDTLLSAAAGSIEGFLSSAMESEYSRGNKYLLFIRGSASFFEIVDAGGAAYFDLADYMAITEEGDATPPYVTIWVRGIGSILSWPPFPVDIGIHKRVFNNSSELPDREFPWEFSLFNLQLPAYGFSVFNYGSDSGTGWFDLECEEASFSLINVSVADVSTASASFEVTRDTLDLVMSSAMAPGLSSITIGTRVLSMLLSSDSTIEGHTILPEFNVGVRNPGDYTDASSGSAQTGDQAVLQVNGGSRSGTVESAGGSDTFSFVVNAAGEFTVETQSGTLADTYMYLYGPGSQSSLVDEDDDSGDGLASRITATLSPGTYYVRVRAYGATATGTYTVRVSSSAIGEGGSGYPTLTVNGATVSGVVSEPGAMQWFEFQVDAAGSHTVETASGTLSDTYLYVYGPGSQTLLVGEDDDSSSGLASKVTANLSPGHYYAAVRAFSATATGTFIIWVGSANSSGGGGIPTLTVDGSIASGEISAQGEVDWYAFQIAVSGDYEIETYSGTLSDTYLHVYGPGSQSLLVDEDDDGGEGLASKVEASLTPGTYYAKVRAFSSSATGSYSLSVRTTSGSGGSGPGYPEISIDGDPEYGDISTAGESDWFTFTVGNSGDYSVETSAGSLSDTFLYLYGPNSQSLLVAEDDDGGSGLASLVTAALSPGTYYVKVRAFSSSSTGTFSVMVASVGGDGGSGGYTALTVDGSSAAGDISSGGESNWFQFTVSSTGDYTVETGSGTLSDTYLYVYGPNSQSILVDQDDDDGEGLASLVTATLSPGTYYAEVRAFSSTSTGTYTIWVGSTGGSGGGSGYPVLQMNGSASLGEISSGGESDWYEFQVTSGGSHTIETGSGTLADTYLYVYGPNSETTLAGEDDDSGSGLASRLTLTLSEGTYYVRVRAFGSTSTGTYSVWVNSSSGGGGYPVLTVNGSSTVGDISTGGESDWYQFYVNSTGSYTVETAAGSLSDTYIYLYGPNSASTYVDENDDGGSGLASLLTRTLSPGTYYVKVRAFDSGSTGSYSVWVTR